MAGEEKKEFDVGKYEAQDNSTWPPYKYEALAIIVMFYNELMWNPKAWSYTDSSGKKVELGKLPNNFQIKDFLHNKQVFDGLCKKYGIELKHNKKYEGVADGKFPEPNCYELVYNNIDSLIGSAFDIAKHSNVDHAQKDANGQGIEMISNKGMSDILDMKAAALQKKFKQAKEDYTKGDANKNYENADTHYENMKRELRIARLKQFGRVIGIGLSLATIGLSGGLLTGTGVLASLIAISRAGRFVTGLAGMFTGLGVTWSFGKRIFDGTAEISGKKQGIRNYRRSLGKLEEGKRKGLRAAKEDYFGAQAIYFYAEKGENSPEFQRVKKYFTERMRRHYGFGTGSVEDIAKEAKYYKESFSGFEKLRKAMGTGGWKGEVSQVNVATEDIGEFKEMLENNAKAKSEDKMSVKELANKLELFNKVKEKLEKVGRNDEVQQIIDMFSVQMQDAFANDLFVKPYSGTSLASDYTNKDSANGVKGKVIREILDGGSDGLRRYEKVLGMITFLKQESERSEELYGEKNTNASFLTSCGVGTDFQIKPTKEMMTKGINQIIKNGGNIKMEDVESIIDEIDSLSTNIKNDSILLEIKELKDSNAKKYLEFMLGKKQNLVGYSVNGIVKEINGLGSYDSNVSAAAAAIARIHFVNPNNDQFDNDKFDISEIIKNENGSVDNQIKIAKDAINRVADEEKKERLTKILEKQMETVSNQESQYYTELMYNAAKGGKASSLSRNMGEDLLKIDINKPETYTQFIDGCISKNANNSVGPYNYYQFKKRVFSLFKREIDTKKSTYEAGNDAVKNIGDMLSKISMCKYLTNIQKEQLLDKMGGSIEKAFNNLFESYNQNIMDNFDNNALTNLRVNPYSKGGFKEFFEGKSTLAEKISKKIDYCANLTEFKNNVFAKVGQNQIDYSVEEKTFLSNVYLDTESKTGGTVERKSENPLRKFINGLSAYETEFEGSKNTFMSGLVEEFRNGRDYRVFQKNKINDCFGPISKSIADITDILDSSKNREPKDEKETAKEAYAALVIFQKRIISSFKSFMQAYLSAIKTINGASNTDDNLWLSAGSNKDLLSEGVELWRNDLKALDDKMKEIANIAGVPAVHKSILPMLGNFKNPSSVISYLNSKEM